jgi:hypothetical protein
MNENGRINNGRMNVRMNNRRINTTRRMNTTVRANTGSSSYMFIGIFILLLVGVGIYFFWTRKLSTTVDTKTFSGLVLGSRVKGKLSDISKFWKSQTEKSIASPLIFLVDCSNNIVWKSGDTFSTSTETKIYTILSKSWLANTNDVVSTWDRTVSSTSSEGSSTSNMEVKSMILVSKESIPKDSAGYTSLSDEEYVKKVMSFATHEYPVNAC